MTGIINTKRLVISRLNSVEIAFYRDFLNDEDSTRFLPLGRPYTTEEINNYLDERTSHWLKHDFGTYQIFLREDLENSIGYVGAEFAGDSGLIDLRYGVKKEYTRIGVVSESVFGFLGTFFSRFESVKLYGVCFPDNLASINILRKIGMKDEETGRPYGECNLVHMSLVKKDFEQKQNARNS